MLLLFGLALILNVSTSSAATVTTNHISPKVTAVNPANNAVILKSQTLKVTFNEIIKAGSSGIELKNGKNVISTKNSISGKTLSITPKTALTTGIKYKIILNPGSVTDLSGNSNKYYTSSFTVSPITLAQMKDGIYRAQKFYAANGRLPNTVHFGSNLIPIAQFQKIIATQGLIIKKPKLTALVVSLSSLDEIMKAASKFRYSHSASTAATMERIGAGDCWAMSDYLYTHMRAAGITARIIQYPTAYSARHRSVQYESNGLWVNAPYRQYFSTSMFNNTQSTGLVIAEG